ncbi:MAG: thiamine diphosphokinase [Puniceicoccales bacterium]|jgi:thiamine pyrophosphokinase|nr:thiamine diphosphokinase [Puniceicoccales bacterium]
MLFEDQKFLEILPTLKTCRSLLCLHGILPKYSFFSHFDLPIIATDGAYDLLRRKGIEADVVIGDDDSVKQSVRAKTKKIVIKDQSLSDFQKALHFTQTHDLSPSVILGVNGGYVDHILNNISILAQSDSIGYMPPTLGLRIEHSLTLHLPQETKLSLFALPSAKVHTRGLRWELKKYWLHFPQNHSCFNRTVNEFVEIEVEEGSIFLVIYLQDIIDAGKTAVGYEC